MESEVIPSGKEGWLNAGLFPCGTGLAENAAFGYNATASWMSSVYVTCTLDARKSWQPEKTRQKQGWPSGGMADAQDLKI